MQKGFVTLGAALAIMLIITASFLTGMRAARQDPPRYAIDGTPVPAELQQPLRDLWQGVGALNRDSYWRPFDQKALLYNAVQGMLSASYPQDTHTAFIPPAINQGVSLGLHEGLFGIGAQVQMTARGLTIKPLIDSPASKAGLRLGDLIVAVDGKSVLTMSEQDAVARIHGDKDTVVSLTIVRQGVVRPFVVRVPRGTIPSVLPLQLGTGGRIGYIQFGGFDANTGYEVHAALKQLLARRVTGLTNDLRENGGGYVTTATQIASEFLPRGTVIFYERSHGDNGRYADTPTRVVESGLAQRIPVVVLVNGDSASASEIFTAALREHNRATVIGTTSYGKGSVQEDLPQPDGSSLRITIRLWLTPRKNSVMNKGIVPDLVVGAGFTGDQDNQIQRAIDYLQRAH